MGRTTSLLILILKSILIIIVVIGIVSTLLFEYKNELECKGEWGNEMNITRDGFGWCKWEVSITFLPSSNELLKWEAKYKGEWKNNKKNGEGVFQSMSGSKYEGEWKDDERHGNGKFTFRDDSSIQGVWRNDNLTDSNAELLFYANHETSSSPQHLTSRYHGEVVDGLMFGDGEFVVFNEQKNVEWRFQCSFRDGLCDCEEGTLIITLKNCNYNNNDKKSIVNEKQNEENCGERRCDFIIEVRKWRNRFQMFYYESEIELFSPQTRIIYALSGSETSSFMITNDDNNNNAERNMKNDNNFDDLKEKEVKFIDEFRDQLRVFEIHFLSKYPQFKSSIYDFGNFEREQSIKQQNYINAQQNKGSNTAEKNDPHHQELIDFEEMMKEFKYKHEHGEL